jgi:DNA modification methylase
MLDAITGGNLKSLEAMQKPKVGLTDPDEVPAEPEEAWVQVGDLFQLGEHRILCGDSTKAGDVDVLMNGLESSLCMTSPPYYNQRPEYATFSSYEEYNGCLSLAIAEVLRVSADPFILAWNTGDNQPDCLPMIADQTTLIHGLGFTYLDTIIWRKAGAVYSIPRSAHIRTHHYYYPALAWEAIIVFRKGDKMPRFNQDDEDAVSTFGINVWDINQVIGSQQSQIGHPAIFPTELASRCIMAYSRTLDNILDPFLGSGTTLIACEKLDRICYGMEIEPRYVQVAIERWQNYTGQKAVKL